MITEKKCKGPCGQTKPIDEFHWKSKRKGTRQARCKACMSDYGHQHYLKNSDDYKNRANTRLKALRSSNRESVDNHLKTHPCQSCGETNFKVLQTSLNSIEINNLAPETLTAKLAESTVKCLNCLAAEQSQ